MTDVEIRKENLETHLDIDKWMQGYKDKWFHIELRFVAGKMHDIVVREYENYDRDK